MNTDYGLGIRLGIWESRYKLREIPVFSLPKIDWGPGFLEFGNPGL